MVEGEVNNGGFNQFYFNSSGQLPTWAFEIIGANKFAELVQKAVGPFQPTTQAISRSKF